MKRVVVLGGYGNFGRRIIKQLLNLPCEIVVVGRSLNKAQRFIDALITGRHIEGLQHIDVKSINAQLSPLVMDVLSDEFRQQLEEIAPTLVVHTSGPFQHQMANVPAVCASLGVHYLDLADDRRYVCDISKLDEQAKRTGSVVVSGASSVPGLSSMVVSHYRNQFKELHNVDIAIAPGNKAQRGLATISGILSYTGKPFKQFDDGQFQNVYGWMNSRTLIFDDIGKRNLANVDVPDLELMPAFFDVKQSVRFQAGLELNILHYTMVFMAWLVKRRLIKSWQPGAGFIFSISRLFEPFGSADGAMSISLDGIGDNLEAQKVRWQLIAKNGVGPFIPTIPCIMLARKLLTEHQIPAGAYPCMALLDMNEFNFYADKLGLVINTETANSLKRG